MKAILMAAGRGTRISKHYPNLPKSCLLVEDKTIIERTVEQLQRHGVTDIAVVIGYQKEMIMESLKNYNVTFFTNPFFNVTNSIASLWMAKEFLKDDDFILMNADLYFDEQMLEKVIEEKNDPVFFVDPLKKEPIDYRFYYENLLLLDHGKELSKTTGEYIGIAKISKGFLPHFIQRMNALIDEQKADLWWENVLYSFIGEKDIHVSEIKHIFWSEVDYLYEYHEILDFHHQRNGVFKIE